MSNLHTKMDSRTSKEDLLGSCYSRVSYTSLHLYLKQFKEHE